MIPGERLSSWLRRIGRLYRLSLSNLLRYDLDCPQLKPQELDFMAPPELITAVSQRTGFTEEAINRMTFAGILPFLSAEPTFEPSSVLWESFENRRIRLSRRMRWIRPSGERRFTGCRQCLVDYPEAAILLFWSFGVVFSCPIHGLQLEPGQIKRGRVFWLNEKPEQAPEWLSCLDNRSCAAFAKGFVQLPAGRVDATMWFRLFYAIYSELEYDVDYREAGRWTWQQQVWKKAGYIPRFYDQAFRFDIRCANLVAVAINQMENKVMEPKGNYGHLFLSGRINRRTSKPIGVPPRTK